MIWYGGKNLGKENCKRYLVFVAGIPAC